MNQYLNNKNSDKLIIFFTGWGCDEHEFEHLDTNSDVLLLFDYLDLNFDFNFSKYKNIDLIAFSAGVFVASIVNFDFKINNKIAISGNPYLFDEKLGLSKEIQNVLCSITEKTADDFAKNYLIKTEDEWKIFRHSQRTLNSCKAEFESLKKIYQKEKENIKNIYDYALIGSDDKIFNVSAQKEFYGNKVHTIKNARHNIFFKIKNYEEIFNLISQ